MEKSKSTHICSVETFHSVKGEDIVDLRRFESSVVDKVFLENNGPLNAIIVQFKSGQQLEVYIDDGDETVYLKHWVPESTGEDWSDESYTIAAIDYKKFGVEEING